MVSRAEVQEHLATQGGRGGVVRALVEALHSAVATAPISGHIVRVITFLCDLHHSIAADLARGDTTACVVEREGGQRVIRHQDSLSIHGGVEAQAGANSAHERGANS